MEKEIIIKELSKMFNRREIVINYMFNILEKEDYNIYEIENSIIDFMKSL